MKGGGKIAIAAGAVGATIAGLWAITRKAESFPGNIVLENLIISPSEVNVGELVTISLIATNIGEEKATKEIVSEVL